MVFSLLKILFITSSILAKKLTLSHSDGDTDIVFDTGFGRVHLESEDSTVPMTTTLRISKGADAFDTAVHFCDLGQRVKSLDLLTCVYEIVKTVRQMRGTNQRRTPRRGNEEPYNLATAAAKSALPSLYAALKEEKKVVEALRGIHLTNQSIKEAVENSIEALQIAIDTHKSFAKPPKAPFPPFVHHEHEILVRANIWDLKDETQKTSRRSYFNSKSFDIYVHEPKKCVYISSRIYEHGFYDPVKTSRISQLLEQARRATGESALFVDIGANIGWFTLLAASQGHRVIAIEPMKYNLELLYASVALNHFDKDLVQVLPFAVGEKSEKFCLRPASGAGEINQYNGQLQRIEEENGDKCTDIVHTVTLDSLLSPWLDIHVLKLDVEGFEAIILRGAYNLLSSSKPPCFIFAEHWTPYATAAGARLHEMFDILKSFGYRAYHQRAPIHALAAKEVGLGEKIPGSTVEGFWSDVRDGHDYEFRHSSKRCRDRSRKGSIPLVRDVQSHLGGRTLVETIDLPKEN
eukprot:g2894.t1